MLSEYQQQELQFLNNPLEWPNVIIACIERSKPPGERRCAFLVHNCGPKLFVKNMFELVDGPLQPQLMGVPTIEFESFEAMLEAGWEVD